MDKIRDTTLSGHSTDPTPTVPKQIDDGQERQTSEVTATSSIEERFANWGSD